MPAIFLNDKDKQLLEEIIREVKAGRINLPSRVNADSGFRENTDHQAPEVYIAKTPSGGITALAGTTPGKASCDIYRIVSNTLEAVPSFSQEVYNLSSTLLAGDTYVSVKRDKYGNWVADSGGGSSVNIRHGIVRSICDQTCDTYNVELVDRSFDETCAAATGSGTGSAAGTGTP